MKTTTIEKIKKGNIFQLRDNGPIFYANGYNRTTRKYTATRSEDISSFRKFNKGTKVLID